MDPGTKQALSIEEIARALTLHLEGKYHAVQHRYSNDAKRQQVLLESFHETKNGKKFRVMTEYDESFTIVDLVDLVDVTNAH